MPHIHEAFFAAPCLNDSLTCAIFNSPNNPALGFSCFCTLCDGFTIIAPCSIMSLVFRNETEFPPEIVRILALPAAVAMSKIQPLLPHLSPQVLERLGRTPIIPPPPGVEPNYEHPELMKRPHTISTSIVLAFTLIFFSNRVYAKTVLAKKASLDDGSFNSHPASIMTNLE